MGKTKIRQVTMEQFKDVEVHSIRLRALRPEGALVEDDFIVEKGPLDVETLEDGHIFVKLLAMSADPFQRGRVKTEESLLKVMQGFVAGEVLASKSDAWKPGAFFGGALPYRSHQVVKVDSTLLWNLTPYVTRETISLGVGVLGMPGATAYGGLLKVLRPKEGETLFVSAASGAVGAVVGQLGAKKLGLTVIGSCGGEKKGERLRELGFQHAIDYKTKKTVEELEAAIRAVAPDGIDMNFENVGGMHFEACMRTLRLRGRVAVCGCISSYDQRTGAGSSPLNLGGLIYTRQRIEGFLSYDYMGDADFLDYLHPLVQDGTLQVDQTFFDGFDAWPAAMLAVLNGNHLGKVVVRIQ